MPVEPRARGLTPATTVAGVVALLLGLVDVLVWTMIDSHQATRRQAVATASNLTLGLEQDIRRAIEVLDLSLQAAVHGMDFPDIATMAPSQRQAILFDGAIMAESFGGASVVNEAGDIIYDSAGPRSKPANVADREYFTSHRDHADLGLTISGPLIGRAQNTKFLVFRSATIRCSSA